MRAERIFSRGGSKKFFNLGEDRQNQFFPNIISVFPKFRGGLILRSSSVSPSLRMKLKHNQNFYILNSIHTRVKLKKNILSINRSCYIAKGKLWISALRNSMHVSFNAFVYCMYETQQKVLVLKYLESKLSPIVQKWFLKCQCIF